jgi:hypothetical protein
MATIAKKSSKKVVAKKVVAKKSAKKVTAPKKATTKAEGSKRFAENEHPVFGPFAIIKDSQQHKLIGRLFASKNKPVPMSALTKATGVSNSATYAILRGLQRKIEEMGTKSKFKIEKEQGDEELSVTFRAK